MAMKGWRRIGIIVSVIWFLGFSIYLWNGADAEADRLRSLRADHCFSDKERSSDRLQYISDPERRKKEEVAIASTYDKCIDDVVEQWSRNHPINNLSRTGAAILGINLATIGLGWLIVWGCVALGRWVHRGFSAP
jgi:hypothetical protein